MEIEKTVTLYEDVSKQQRALLWAVLTRVAAQVEKNVKLAMPVDTGRARASWGRWSDKLRAPRHGKKGKPLAKDLKQIAAANDAESIWIEDESKLTIVQGSNVVYIEALNDGHSQQASSGFIDVIAAEALTVLEKASLEVMEKF